MSKIRMRYLAAGAAAAAVAATTVIASPAGAVTVPSFQRIQATAKDSRITANCFFQVTYVSLVNGTVTGNMNGQAQSNTVLQALGTKNTTIGCELKNSNGDQQSFFVTKAGGGSQTGVHSVTLPLAAHYTLYVLGQQNYFNGGSDGVFNFTSTP